MRILADENFPKPIVEALRAGGNDALWARTDCCGGLDEDSWRIAVQRRVPLEQSGVVWFRIHPATPENLEPLVRTFVEARKAWTGHVGIVTAGGIQMRSFRRN
jgi:hypothetical protein